MSAFESASFRFPPGLRDELADAARLAGRSLNAEVIARLRRSLGERDGATASRGAATADGAASSRSPSVGPVEEREVRPTVPAREVTVPIGASRSSSGVCAHGLSAGVCLRPECKGLS